MWYFDRMLYWGVRCQAICCTCFNLRLWTWKTRSVSDVNDFAHTIWNKYTREKQLANERDEEAADVDKHQKKQIKGTRWTQFTHTHSQGFLSIWKGGTFTKKQISNRLTQLIARKLLFQEYACVCVFDYKSGVYPVLVLELILCPVLPEIWCCFRPIPVASPPAFICCASE